jgi:anti-sigma regulatory factor (Ser/Thr protein kinase)
VRPARSTRPMSAHTTSVAALKPPADWRSGRTQRLQISGGPQAPERVRSWLQATTGWLPDELEKALLLLTSELVNNSVLHGEAGEQDVIEIELQATPDCLRAQVTDSGCGFAPTGRRRELDEPGGWGLVLVERMARAWGVERDDCTRVWFELAAA